jgi:capsular exopolysaccharide synthesis family protein
MSNNFEILSQLELSHDLSPSMTDIPTESSASRSASGNGKLPNSYSEALNLVQRVFLTKPDIAPHIVVFASPESGAGCSWVCARTSEALADRQPGAVCVVDANLRSPAMHQYFRLANSRGLTQALLERAPISDYVQDVRNGRLSVLTSGSVTSQTTAWTSDHLIERIAELRQTFDFLLIDSPAMNLYTDIALLSSMADGAILVIEAYSTRREAALQAKEALLAAKFKLLGAAINKRTFPIPEFIYRNL